MVAICVPSTYDKMSALLEGIRKIRFFGGSKVLFHIGKGPTSSHR